MERRRFIEGLAASAFASDVGVRGPAVVAAGMQMCLDVRDFGARGDDKSDDADAIIRAITEAKGGFVCIPAGRYRLGRDLIFGTTVNLVGVPGRTILVPTRNGGVGLTLSTPTSEGTTETSSLFGIKLDGASCRGSTGVLIGANDVTGRIRSSHLEVVGFHGDGAVGLRVQNSVDCSFEYSYFGRNTTNVVIEGVSADLPTLTRFHVCSFREADTVGVRIRRGYMTTFSQCLMEANKREGVRIEPPSRSTVLRTSFDRCWFEKNFLRAADQAQQFHFVADGTNAGAELRISEVYMSGLSKAIRLKNVVNFVLDDVLVQTAEGTIFTEGENCNGSIVNMPLNSALRLDRLWTNTAKHDMISVGTTRGAPSTSQRVDLSGWGFSGELTTGRSVPLVDRVAPLGRVVLRQASLTRIAATVLDGGASGPVLLSVQRSADGGGTWALVPGAEMSFDPTRGGHLQDFKPGNVRLTEGDVLRLQLRPGPNAPQRLSIEVSMELDVSSWWAPGR
jgi:hypothetical protein